EGEVLHASHGVALHAPNEGRAQLADVVGVLTVGLLGPAPGRVAQEVHAHAAVERGPGRPELEADSVADAVLEVRVECRAARHAHREAGARAHDDTAGAIAEPKAGHAKSLDGGGGPGVAVVPP